MKLLISALLILTITGPLEICANGILYYLPKEGVIRIAVDRETWKIIKCQEKEKNHANETVSETT